MAGADALTASHAATHADAIATSIATAASVAAGIASSSTAASASSATTASAATTSAATTSAGGEGIAGRRKCKREGNDYRQNAHVQLLMITAALDQTHIPGPSLPGSANPRPRVFRRR